MKRLGMFEMIVLDTQIHKDPFDRIIIASALEYHAQLASIDDNFPKYPELQLLLMQS
jgi:PIN domain nuclease of toxin-antitoxin system